MDPTDTPSNATTLPPAPSASERDDDSSTSARYPEGTGGVPRFPGGHNALGYSGGPTNASTASALGEGGVGGQAPSYANNQSDSFNAADKVPKGSNITEGGFAGQARNTGEDAFKYSLGGKNDPAREALQGYGNQGSTAGPGVDNNAGAADQGEGGNAFEALDRSEEA